MLAGQMLQVGAEPTALRSTELENRSESMECLGLTELLPNVAELDSSEESTEHSSPGGTVTDDSELDSHDDSVEYLGISEVVRYLSANPRYENTYFSIRESPKAGLGAFANRDLKRGDVILRERPLFEANLNSLFQEFDILDQAVKDVAMGLYGNSRAKASMPRLANVWRTNCFATRRDRAGLFAIASRFNHACHPVQSVDYTFDDESGYIEFTVRAETIRAGEELTITYGEGRPSEVLYFWYGFRCRCDICADLSDEEVTGITEDRGNHYW